MKYSEEKYKTLHSDHFLYLLGNIADSDIGYCSRYRHSLICLSVYYICFSHLQSKMLFAS